MKLQKIVSSKKNKKVKKIRKIKCNEEREKGVVKKKKIKIRKVENNLNRM